MTAQSRVPAATVTKTSVPGQPALTRSGRPTLSRSELMRRIKSRDTKPEVAFAAEHPEAVVHPAWLPFHPDFAESGKVVFIDSDFWHCTGRINFLRLSPFWQEKLVRNLCRDLAREAFYGAFDEMSLIEVY